MTVTPSRSSVLAGRYETGDLLGRGGMAEVRAGTDLRLQRPVAVKFLLPAMAARDDIRRRFEAEACAAASLSDPHAVAVYDTGEQDGVPFIVMERLPGETLADRIPDGPLDPDWVRRVAVEVLGALAAAHAVGLVHRDVKPGNILITADGHAKIADFGIAKSLERSAGDLDLTGTGQLLGTPAYLAPERLEGAPASARSDLYALGVVMYEALTGQCPFPGTTPLASARAIAAGDYTPLDEVRPGLDRDLVAAVERAMATSPTDRFESAGDMATALSSDPSASTVVMDRAALSRTRILDAGALRPRARERRNWLPVVLLAGLVFVALLVAALNRGGRPESTQGAPSERSPSSTVPASPTAALASDLRSFAGRLGPADGARARDLATLVRHVADQVEAGGGGPAATATMVSAGAWRATGQLVPGTAASAVDLLSRVPGATVVTIPSQVPASASGPASAPAAPSGSVAGTSDKGHDEGKGKHDDKGKGKD